MCNPLSGGSWNRFVLWATTGALLGTGLSAGMSDRAQAQPTAESFAQEAARALPEERLYDFHKRLAAEPVHRPRRAVDARPAAGEMEIAGHGWKLIVSRRCSPLVRRAAEDFRDYLDKSMGVQVELDACESLADWQTRSHVIVAGTREQLPGCGPSLAGPKDYQIVATPQRVVVCGFDDRGAMFGLYNIEARMNLREGPFLRGDLNTVRRSLHQSRMVMSWMGWMEWPDAVLSHLAHDGFDAIFASAYANPNGDTTTADTSTDFYARILYRMRRQDPARMRDLLSRAARRGLKVYTPILYQYLGTPESEAGLRRLTRDIVREFPDIHGYILLTEGFWYKQWGGGHGASDEYLHDWARNWARAVAIVAEECHRVNPAIEILPWEYNIDFRPQNIERKRYFIRQLPQDTIPLLTWENGKSFPVEGYQGHVTDYSISQVGPAEVTHAQIEEARRRKMKVYSNADTFVCGAQLQTVPYHPFPYQWHARYKALEKYAVDGTLESWSTGYTPSFMTELRAWHCWSDAPPLDELLGAIAARHFGPARKQDVLKAWNLFSQAIGLVPDTGPTMGTSHAIGNPLFFREPPARTAMFTRSWMDQAKWTGYMGGELNPYWPFTVSRLVFMPDFSNQSNRAEQYARAVSGIQAAETVQVLPAFLSRLRSAGERFQHGLRLYRSAALASPPEKRPQAIKDVNIAEQIRRMLQSEHAILEFEDLRLQWARQTDPRKAAEVAQKMKAVVRDEIGRTELSLAAATRDSRLGFQFECDYVYTPFSLREKLKVLSETLEQLTAPTTPP